MITIIVLLILAGVTIATLAGNNGILTRAKEAKIVTEQANLKEELTIAMANYEIAKSKNEELTLTDFLQNTEQSGLTNIKVIEQTNNQLIGSNQDYIFIVDETGNLKVSDTPNLIRNEMGEQGDNTNFSQATYLSEGYFSYDSYGHSDFSTDEFIPVDPAKTYCQIATMKSTNPNAVYYIGFQEYDEDYRRIRSNNYLTIPNTLTFLEKNLEVGDTEVYLHDVSAFKTEGSATYQRGLIFWNYQNTSGYQYPELTYSRYVYPSSDATELFKSENVNKTNHVIKLNEAWSGPKFPKGTKVSQKNSASEWNYGLCANKKLSNEWTTYSNTVHGVLSGETPINFLGFRPGTKYVKFGAIVNHGSLVSETTFDLKNVIFTEMEK